MVGTLRIPNPTTPYKRLPCENIYPFSSTSRNLRPGGETKYKRRGRCMLKIQPNIRVSPRCWFRRSVQSSSLGKPFPPLNMNKTREPPTPNTPTAVRFHRCVLSPTIDFQLPPTPHLHHGVLHPSRFFHNDVGIGRPGVSVLVCSGWCILNLTVADPWVFTRARTHVCPGEFNLQFPPAKWISYLTDGWRIVETRENKQFLSSVRFEWKYGNIAFSSRMEIIWEVP